MRCLPSGVWQSEMRYYLLPALLWRLVGELFVFLCSVSVCLSVSLSLSDVSYTILFAPCQVQVRHLARTSDGRWRASVVLHPVHEHNHNRPTTGTVLFDEGGSHHRSLDATTPRQNIRAGGADFIHTGAFAYNR